MAQSDRQGTGRHPHKSTEEAYPHTRDNRGEGEHRPRPASRTGGSDRSSHSRGDEAHRSSQGAHQGGSQDADLKQREYRDEHGEVHHHTRTYMEQHRGERDKK
jgi:hypothetical protein